MGRLKAIEISELYWFDQVTSYSGWQVFDVEDKSAHSFVDESADIEALSESAKILLGADNTRGFKDVIHLMKFIVGEAPAPDPSPDPTGGVPALVAA